MSTDEREKLAFINALKELDCCSRCILLFFGNEFIETIADSYLEPDAKLKSLGYVKDEEPQPKIPKKNWCSACLGVLEDAVIEQYVSTIDLEEFDYYKSDEFITYVSLPKSVLLRTYSIYLHLHKSFPDLMKNPYAARDDCTKRIFRMASAEFISKKIKRIYKAKAKLTVEFEMMYENDEQEVDKLRKKKSTFILSRPQIHNFIKTCTEEEFREVFPVPPSSPTNAPMCRVKLKGVPLYLGGRYLKFSRDMGQTPFIVNNKHVTEHNFESILFDSIRKVLGFKCNMVLSSSGREDSDTRMLGDGRPFYVQIEDPGFYDITFQLCRQIEDDILASNICAVIRLQPISSNEIVDIKEGEERKKKRYRALCYTTHPNLDDVLRILNKYDNESLEIAQKTPIRVLHRRSLAVRPKIIHSMKASSVPNHPELIQLDLVTQAGTYVKEFVNSDLNRTIPSVASLIECPIDVVALDVTKVELEWP